MTNYRRAFVPGATYFFTADLADRRKTLLVDHIDLLREAVRRTQPRHPFVIDAMVVLPDHLHTIWTLPSDDANSPLRLRLIRRKIEVGTGMTRAPEIVSDGYRCAQPILRAKTHHRPGHPLTRTPLGPHLLANHQGALEPFRC